MVFEVRSMISSWNFALLNPRMNGAPGMPLDAMAQTNFCFLSVAQCSGGMSSTDVQPSCLATSQVLSALHLSPRALKHQNATDCLTRPLSTGLGSSAAVVSCAVAMVADAATAVFSKCRLFRTARSSGRTGEWCEELFA